MIFVGALFSSKPISMCVDHILLLIRARMTGRIDLTVCCFSLGTQMILMIHQMPLLWFCVRCIMSLQWMSNRNRNQPKWEVFHCHARLRECTSPIASLKLDDVVLFLHHNCCAVGICPSCLNYNDLWRHWWELDAGNHPQMSLSFSYVQVRVLISGWE